MTLLQQNLDKARELKESVRWAYILGSNRCDQLNLHFKTLDVGRSAARQHAYWRQGRDLPGRIVTELDGYKKASMHQLGLAFDVLPINCSYQDIADVFAQFGVTHPFGAKDKTKNKGFIDEPHFQLDQVGPQPTPVGDAKARIRGYERALRVSETPEMRQHWQTLIDRTTRRMSS